MPNISFSLETLYANDTGLNEIIFDDCEYLSKTEMFPNLSVLSLNENRINSVIINNYYQLIHCLIF